MKERGNWLNLPGKNNSVLWNLGPRKSLTITPHITVWLFAGWRFRIEGTYSFHFYREPLPTFGDVKGILRVDRKGESDE